MNQLINVAIICGGNSNEHQVSLISAKNIISRLDSNKYRILIIAIERNGTWRFSQNDDWLIGQNIDEVKINPHNPEVYLIKGGQLIEKQTANPIAKIDVVFPIIHGETGEDGTLQGFLKFLEIPFVGSQTLGSAVSNDKEITKRILRDNKLPVIPFLILNTNTNISFKNATHQLKSETLFVKPCHLGSSIGVSKASQCNEFKESLKTAFQYDDKVIIEPFIEGREIECAILGNNFAKASSVVGEIITNKNQFYSYENKYINSNEVVIANIEKNLLEEIRQCAISAFQCLECRGMARVDFFLQKDSSFFINEINTLPGFTEISMYPKLWEASGLQYPDLLDKLINLAL